MSLKVKVILLAIAAITAFSSCSIKSKDIELSALHGARVEGVTLSQARMNIQLSLYNHSGSRLVLKNSDLEISDGRGKIMTIRTDEKIILKAHRMTEVTLPVMIRFHDPLGTVGSTMRLSKNPESLRVKGTVRGSNGLIGLKYNFDDVPLAEFLRKMGISENDLKKISL